MRRLQGARCTSRSRGTADPLLIQKHEHAFGINTFNSEVRRVRQAVFSMTIDLNRWNRVEEPLFETIAQCLDASVFVLKRRGSNFSRLPKGDDGGRIFGATALLILLATADEVRIESGLPIDIQRRDTLRRM